MAEEISKPLSAAQKVTMVSSGGAEVGASKLAGEVLDIMTKLPATVEKLTGVDISLVNQAIYTQDNSEKPSTGVALIPCFLLTSRLQEQGSVRIKKSGSSKDIMTNINSFLCL